MSHSQLHSIRRGLVVVAAAGLGLTMAACSSDDSDAAKTSSNPAKTSTTSSQATSSSDSAASPATSSSSLASLPSTTSMGVAADALGATVSQNQTEELSRLLGLKAASSDGADRGGSSGSAVLQPGSHHFKSGQSGGVAQTVTVTAACLGTSVKTDIVVTLTPDSRKPKETVSKTMTCPAGTTMGLGMKIWSGKAYDIKVTGVNQGTKPIAFAVGYLDGQV